MPQVNISLDEKQYEALVMEAADRQKTAKRLIRLGALLGELAQPVLNELVGKHMPSETASKEHKQEEDPTPTTNPTKQSKLAFDFDGLEL